MRKKLKQKSKKQSGKNSDIRLYALLTAILPGIFALIVFLIGGFGTSLSSAMLYYYGLMASSILSAIIILGAITYIYGNRPYDWRFYVLPLVVPAIIGGSILFNSAREYYSEHANDQPHSSASYKRYVAHKSQCDAIDVFYGGAGPLNTTSSYTRSLSDDNVVAIIKKTGIDADALKRRIDEMSNYARVSWPQGDCAAGGMSEDAATRVEAMYAKVGPLRSDITKFDDVYQAEFTATYGNPAVFPDDNDTTPPYNWTN